jgi:phosphatidate cytidylyltransferase
MSEILKRIIFGAIYVTIMWFGTSYSELTFNILFLCLGLWSLFEMWKLRKGKSKLIAFLYILIPFFLIQLFGMTDIDYPKNKFNPSIVLLMFILTWTFDTFAFVVGVKFGKNRILPTVSPKKSWEGFIGGWLSCLLAGFISQYYFRSYFENISYSTIIVLSLILPFTATLGDFIESYYKRQAGVKDSGTLIPGHGGILDRMDAFMVTIPVIYILINLI